MRLNSLIGVLFLAILKMSSQTITIEHDCISNKQKVAIVKNTSDIPQILWLIPDNKKYQENPLKYLTVKINDFSIYKVIKEYGSTLYADKGCLNIPYYNFIKYLAPGKTFRFIFNVDISTDYILSNIYVLPMNSSRYFVTEDSEAYKALSFKGDSIIIPNVDANSNMENIESQRTISYGVGKFYDVYQVRGDDNATEFFEFVSNNISGSDECIEFGLIKTGFEGSGGLNFITTGHASGSEPGMSYLNYNRLQYGHTIQRMTHSHPIRNSADIADINYAKQIHFNINKKEIPQFIYHVPTKNYIQFYP